MREVTPPDEVPVNEEDPLQDGPPQNGLPAPSGGGSGGNAGLPPAAHAEGGTVSGGGGGAAQVMPLLVLKSAKRLRRSPVTKWPEQQYAGIWPSPQQVVWYVEHRLLHKELFCYLMVHMHRPPAGSASLSRLLQVDDVAEIASSPGVCRSGSGTCGEQSSQVNIGTTWSLSTNKCKFHHRPAHQQLHLQDKPSGAGVCLSCCTVPEWCVSSVATSHHSA